MSLAHILIDKVMGSVPEERLIEELFRRADKEKPPGTGVNSFCDSIQLFRVPTDDKKKAGTVEHEDFCMESNEPPGVYNIEPSKN